MFKTILQHPKQLNIDSWIRDHCEMVIIWLIPVKNTGLGEGLYWPAATADVDKVSFAWSKTVLSDPIPLTAIVWQQRWPCKVSSVYHGQKLITNYRTQAPDGTNDLHVSREMMLAPEPKTAQWNVYWNAVVFVALRVKTWCKYGLLIKVNFFLTDFWSIPGRLWYWIALVGWDFLILVIEGEMEMLLKEHIDNELICIWG